MAERRARRGDQGPGSERERFVAAVWETLADERETVADEREVLADEREAEADAREGELDARESAIDRWEGRRGRVSAEESKARQPGRQLRLEAADRRGEAAERRDSAPQPQPASERWRLGGDLARQFAMLAAEFYSEDTFEVTDDTSGWPVVADPAGDSEHGRGMLLVEALAQSWGVEPGPVTGKTVWFELSWP